MCSRFEIDAWRFLFQCVSVCVCSYVLGCMFNDECNFNFVKVVHINNIMQFE